MFTLILLVFAFVLFFIAGLWNPATHSSEQQVTLGTYILEYLKLSAPEL